jgi:hypothetical protein
VNMRWLAVLWLVACGNTMNRTEDLMTDVRTFQEGIRWRKYEMAADYVPAAARERFLEAQDVIDKDLRIDDYELERVKLESGQTAARVRVKYTWHLDSVGTVHDTVVEERWERQGKVWRVVASEHKRGEEMPRAEVVSGGLALP